MHWVLSFFYTVAVMYSANFCVSVCVCVPCALCVSLNVEKHDKCRCKAAATAESRHRAAQTTSPFIHGDPAANLCVHSSNCKLGSAQHCVCMCVCRYIAQHRSLDAGFISPSSAAAREATNFSYRYVIFRVFFTHANLARLLALVRSRPLTCLSSVPSEKAANKRSKSTAALRTTCKACCCHRFSL